MKMIPRPAVRYASALLALAGFAASADSGAAGLFFYKFTAIADSQGGFPYQSLDPFPSINSSGRVSFGGTLTGGVEGIFTRLGTGGVSTLIDNATSGYSTFGIVTSINSGGMVAFDALKITPSATTTTILRGQGNSATPLLTDTGSLSEFCGSQMNIQGAVALRGTRTNGKHEIRTQGAGQLSGVTRLIAEEGSEFTALGCEPSISFDNTVAFTATRNGHRAIFTRSESGVLTQMIDDTSIFSSFADVALNQQGGLAFSGSLDASGRGLYRLKGGFLTKIADTISANSNGNPAGFSINESGTVAYELSRDASGSSIHLGPGILFGRLLGTGDVLFNRSVFVAHIGRDALNSIGQVIVSVNFFGGATMIARGDPVKLPDNVIYTGGLLVSTGFGGSVNVSNTLPVPPKGAVLTFDLTFLSPGGRLDVKFGDKVLQSIAPKEIGVRQVISVPLDPKLGQGTLQFVMSGKEGASAQIAAITVPGLSSGPLDADKLASWKFDESGRGTAAVINAARYPVKVQLTSTGKAADPRKPGIILVNAAVLSDEGVDASADLVRASLRIAGVAPRVVTDKAGVSQQACAVSDVNGDKLADLVCDVELPDTAAKAGALPVESMTNSGWGVEGASVLATPRYTK